jgi:hypothetical protein
VAAGHQLSAGHGIGQPQSLPRRRRGAASRAAARCRNLADVSGHWACSRRRGGYDRASTPRSAHPEATRRDRDAASERPRVHHINDT